MTAHRDPLHPKDPPKLGDQLLSLTGLLQPVSFEDTYSELLRETHEFSIRYVCLPAVFSSR